MNGNPLFTVSEIRECERFTMENEPISSVALMERAGAVCADEILMKIWIDGYEEVYVYAGTGKITINDRDIDDYFGLDTLKLIVRQPLNVTELNDKFDIVCRVTGGGVTGQAGAIRHGLARALLQYDESLRPVLKKAGFLTRDPRMKERKKYGLKGARRAPQFSKR